MLSHDELALKPTLTTLNLLMKSLSEEFNKNHMRGGAVEAL